MNMMKMKSDKVSIVQAHSQGFFLLERPSIPTPCPAIVELGSSYSHMAVLLEFESKEICMLTPNFFFNS